MKLDNRLPLPALAFRQFAEGDRFDCVVAVRGTFLHRQDEAAAPAVRMEPFQYEDVYAGDPHETCLVRQTDLTPEKPGTDVTFLGSSFAPGGEPLPSWTCGLRVGPVRKELRVTGPRRWWAEDLSSQALEIGTDFRCSKEYIRRYLQSYHQGQFRMQPDQLVRGQKSGLTSEQIGAVGNRVRWTNQTSGPAPR